jgi:phosphoserine phosphatase
MERDKLQEWRDIASYIEQACNATPWTMGRRWEIEEKARTLRQMLEKELTVPN